MVYGAGQFTQVSLGVYPARGVSLMTFPEYVPFASSRISINALGAPVLSSMLCQIPVMSFANEKLLTTDKNNAPISCLPIIKNPFNV